MTTPYREHTTCPHCGSTIDTETPFNRWMRANPRLDSIRAGFVRFDGDQILHRYMRPELPNGMRREVQAIMVIEVKTFGAVLSPQQQDTLSLFSQVLRNRRDNMHQQKRGLHALDHTPLARAISRMHNREVRLRMFGAHLLRMEADSPETSKWIEWDHKRIDVPTLEALILFDLDPDTLTRMDWRPRSQPKTGGLFDWGSSHV